MNCLVSLFTFYANILSSNSRCKLEGKWRRSLPVIISRLPSSRWVEITSPIVTAPLVNQQTPREGAKRRVGQCQGQYLNLGEEKIHYDFAFPRNYATYNVSKASWLLIRQKICVDIKWWKSVSCCTFSGSWVKSNEKLEKSAKLVHSDKTHPLKIITPSCSAWVWLLKEYSGYKITRLWSA